LPVTVVLDYRQRHSARRLRRSIATLVGGLLVLVGAIASIGLFPSFVYVVGIAFDEPKLLPTLLEPLEMSLDWLGIDVSWWHQTLPAWNADLLLATAVSITIMVVGLTVGLRLLRGNRKLVLFLRRFGYSDATKVATFAAAKTIGRSWRLVTLDDASVAPLGVPTSTRRLVVGGGLVRQGVMVAPMFVAYVGMFTLGAPCVILLLAFLQAKTLDLDVAHSFEPYGRVLESVLAGHIPFDAIGSNLVGAFAVAATLTMFTVWALIASFAGLLATLMFSGPFSLLGFASDAVLAADRLTTRQVKNATEIDSAARAIAAESRKIFAPRLVVLRVASEVWRQTVIRLASTGSLTIIDVSEPTENLVWEIQELTERSGPRCVFVGQSDRVARLTASSEDVPPPGPIDERLLRLLDGREVLAYVTNRRGMRRFARALRARLLELSA
jgi:hypothetical protein